MPSRLQATLKEKEDAAVEAIKKDMQGSDIWENEILSILFKVGGWVSTWAHTLQPRLHGTSHCELTCANDD
jgi:hypothetical protein